MKGDGEVRGAIRGGSSPVATHSLPARPPRYRFQNAGSPPTLPVSNAVPASSMARSLTSPYGSGRGGAAPRAGGRGGLRGLVAGWAGGVTQVASHHHAAPPGRGPRGPRGGRGGRALSG